MRNSRFKYTEKDVIKIWTSGFAIGFVVATSIASLMILIIDM